VISARHHGVVPARLAETPGEWKTIEYQQLNIVRVVFAVCVIWGKRKCGRR
jgi:hypothetical protein